MASSKPFCVEPGCRMCQWAGFFTDAEARYPLAWPSAPPVASPPLLALEQRGTCQPVSSNLPQKPVGTCQQVQSSVLPQVPTKRADTAATTVGVSGMKKARRPEEFPPCTRVRLAWLYRGVNDVQPSLFGFNETCTQKPPPPL